ncbi:MAG: hypothetical protein AAF579_21465, partial [Cyanobacteria bacterium P01_C01_bin.118]
TNAAAEINDQSCANVGMVFENISFEYPYWLLLNAPRQGFKAQHVEVTNESAPLQTQDRYNRFVPCLVLKTSSQAIDAPLETELQVEDRIYREIWQQTADTETAQKSAQLFAAN